ncbi:MAG TPA: S41 family peptidase [Pirellulales bacterium]|nr:S41 family peptidase [Pirellulales bacterium]
MRLRLSLRGAALLGAAALGLVVAGPSLAQQPANFPPVGGLPLTIQPAGVERTLPPQLLPIPVPPAPLGSASTAPTADPQVLVRGEKFEIERRWGEALSLYEEAYRSNPAASGLNQRIDLARIHYDLGRRYADASFRRSLTQLDENRALDLYSEVLNKVFSHYVVDPDWQHIVEHGTLDFEVALGEPMFLASALGAQGQIQPGPQEIDAFRRELHQLVDGRAIHNADEARAAVAAAANLAQDKLHLSPTSTILEYTGGAAGGLDEYSTFLTPDQLNDLYSQIEGNFVGLGVELKSADNALLIVNVIHGSPAERAGLKAADRIVAVAGHSTHDLSTDQAAELLQGAEGTSVALTIASASQPDRSLTLRREHVDVPSVDDIRIIDAANGVGYFKLTCFQKTTSRDLDNALWQLHRQGMRSLVMDLRGNPGGLLTAAVDASDKFIDQGNIVSTRGRSPQEDYVYTAHSMSVWHLPLVVLIDGDSASASEIFAGAVRDHSRGVLVGTRSYGKGSVQGIFPLAVGGAGIRLTTAKFYSPNGHPFAHIGVQPDIVVHQTAKPIDGQVAVRAPGEPDAILAAGLEAARRQLARQ